MIRDITRFAFCLSILACGGPEELDESADAISFERGADEAEGAESQAVEGLGEQTGDVSLASGGDNVADDVATIANVRWYCVYETTGDHEGDNCKPGKPTVICLEAKSGNEKCQKTSLSTFSGAYLNVEQAGSECEYYGASFYTGPVNVCETLRGTRGVVVGNNVPPT